MTEYEITSEPLRLGSTVRVSIQVWKDVGCGDDVNDIKWRSISSPWPRESFSFTPGSVRERYLNETVTNGHVLEEELGIAVEEISTTLSPASSRLVGSTNGPADSPVVLVGQI
jgi:hypothetical protein